MKEEGKIIKYKNEFQYEMQISVFHAESLSDDLRKAILKNFVIIINCFFILNDLSFFFSSILHAQILI